MGYRGELSRALVNSVIPLREEEVEEGFFCGGGRDFEVKIIISL